MALQHSSRSYSLRPREELLSRPRSPEPAPYSYRPLEKDEFRFIELLPGHPDEPIRIRIFHSAILKPSNQPAPRMSLAEVTVTLPWGWEVFETTSGRYLFWNKDPNVSIDAAVFWDHPDASIDPSTYLPPKVERSPKYEALSYTWGTDTNPSTILVDEGPEKPVTALGVGPNLMEALRHLQPGDATTTRILWIDAICINQADTMEKSVQVQLMGSIYKQAHRVVIWLGPEEDDSSLALSEIKRFGEQVEYSMSTDNRFVSPGAKHLDWFKRAIPLPFDSNACRAINDLF